MAFIPTPDQFPTWQEWARHVVEVLSDSVDTGSASPTVSVPPPIIKILRSASGTYVLEGPAVNLRVGPFHFLMQAVAASYGLSGGAAQLFFGAQAPLAALAGVYAYTGYAATLTHGGVQSSGLPAQGTAVPTFHSIGLYWQPVDTNGQSVAPLNDTVKMRYKRSTDVAWRTGHDMWYDGRAIGGRPREARGSIVHCIPGTSYDVQFGLPQADGTTVWVGQLSTITWSENFPIGDTVPTWAGTNSTTSHSLYPAPLNSGRNQVLLVDRSGTPAGYTLYDFTGKNAVAQAPNSSNTFCVVISASYVILRGLTCKGGGDASIWIDPGFHDIVIESCDISGWGTTSGGTYVINSVGTVTAGGDEQPGISIQPYPGKFGSAPASRVIVQRNKIHNPLYGASPWDYGHPHGPTGITIYPSGGNHVIRYNEFYSTLDGTPTGEPDPLHFFTDCITSGNNFDYVGAPGPDTDVYKNIFSCAMDDSMENEGGGMNVRVWSNYVDISATGLASTSVALGPLYLWRNVYNRCRKLYNQTWGNEADRLNMFKSGNDSTYGNGRRYIYHNTALQYPPGSGEGPNTLGSWECVTGTGTGAQAVANTVTRNNIFDTYYTPPVSQPHGVPTRIVGEWVYMYQGPTIGQLLTAAPSVNYGSIMVAVGNEDGTGTVHLDTPIQTGSPSEPAFGVWCGADLTKDDNFAAWVGRSLDIAVTYTARDTWANLANNAWWIALYQPWKQARTGRKLDIALSLTVSGTSLDDVANGLHDATYQTIADQFANAGFLDDYIRLGHEMDGTWYPWHAETLTLAASYKRAWQHVVDVMRARQPTNTWKFVMCFSLDSQPSVNQTWIDTIYPGDTYVDVIGIDWYDQSWVSNTYPYPSNCDAACHLQRQQTAWNSYLNSTWKFIRALAVAHGKPMAFPEWAVLMLDNGHGGLDDPYFVEQTWKLINDPANNFAYASYFNDRNLPSYDEQIFPDTNFPNASAKFKALFSAPTATLSSSEVSQWRQSGRTALLVVGGSNQQNPPGGLTLLSSTNEDELFNSLTSLVDQTGVNGIDFSLTGGPAQWTPQRLANVCARLKQKYGAGFVIQCSPRPFEIRNSTGIYTEFVVAAGSNCDIVAPSWYFTNGYTDTQYLSQIASDLTAMVETLAIPASKILIGASAPPTGATGWPDLYVTAYQNARQGGTINGIDWGVPKPLRGLMNWSTFEDSSNGYSFAQKAAAVVSPTLDAGGTAVAGDVGTGVGKRAAFQQIGSGNDFDYDMTNSTNMGTSESHGRANSPAKYKSGNGPLGFSYPAGHFQLSAGAVGNNDGALIPNFNNDVDAPFQYLGTGPDRGAHEEGTRDMIFGVSATGS